MSKLKYKGLMIYIWLTTTLFSNRVVNAEDRKTVSDLIEGYSNKDASQLVETQINFQQEVSEHSAGIFEFLGFVFQLVLSVIVVIALGYFLYLGITELLDKISKK